MSNLPLPESVVLHALRIGGPLSANEICRVVEESFGCQISRTSIHRYLGNLEEAGLISANPDTRHPRLWETVEEKDQSWRSIGEIAEGLAARLRIREEETVA